jgi:Tfp pilus assembly protein PilN
MANINLYQSIQEEKNTSQKKGIMDKGLSVVILILVLTFAIWGGLKLYNLFLNKKLVSLNSQITAESGKVDAGKMNRVADFQERMNIIKQNIAQKEDPAEFLGNLEKSVIPGIVIDSCEFKYGDKDKGDTLALTAITDSFNSLAGQILSLKKIDYFKNVEMGSVTRDQDGKIRFVINAGFGSPAK